MNEIKTFSPEQQVVLDRIAEGKSIGAAAHAAGIHRNTVANWRHASDDFRIAYERAHYDQVMACRDRAVDLAPEATYTIMCLMKNPSTPPGVRLRAALEIQKRAETLPPPDPSAVKAETLAQSAQSAQTESETAAILVILKQMIGALDRFLAGGAPNEGPAPLPQGPPSQADKDSLLAMLNSLSSQCSAKPGHSAQPAQSAQSTRVSRKGSFQGSSPAPLAAQPAQLAQRPAGLSL